MTHGGKRAGAGRPSEGRTVHVDVRVTEAQRDEYRVAAREAGARDVSEWARMVLTREARRLERARR